MDAEDARLVQRAALFTYDLNPTIVLSPPCRARLDAPLRLPIGLH